MHNSRLDINIADFGEEVFYTGDLSHTRDIITRRLMKEFLIPGNWYKVERILQDEIYYYYIETFWCPCGSFKRNLRRVMERKYGLI